MAKNKLKHMILNDSNRMCVLWKTGYVSIGRTVNNEQLKSFATKHGKTT